MDPKDPGELTPDELAGEIAEALPERAAMSTVSMTGLDAATGTVEAVSDGVTESAAATTEAAPEATTTAAPEPVEATTTAAPEPAEAAPVVHGGGAANAAQHANEHSHVAQQAAQQPAAEAPAPSAPVTAAPETAG